MISTSSASVEAHLGEHRARLADDAGAVGRVLVPGRRQAEHRPRVAGAQRADDDVVDVRSVLDDDDVLALRAAEAELGDGGRAVVEQPGLVVGVGPRPGDDLGAVQRADVVGVRLMKPVDDRRVDEAPLERAAIRALRRAGPARGGRAGWGSAVMRAPGSSRRGDGEDEGLAVRRPRARGSRRRRRRRTARSRR